MNEKFLYINKRQKPPRFDPSQIIRIILLILASIIIIYIATIPWRNYVAKYLIEKGEEFLAERNYTLAYVNFEKANLLSPQNRTAEERMQLAKDAVLDIALLKDILREKNADLLKVLELSEQKSCDLENNKLMIEKELSQIAAINLKFCANEGPKDFESWLYLGIAYLRFSENNQVFKEQKPELREKSLSAFEKAYYADPTQKVALEYLVEVNKITDNSEKVDYWQRLLDNLNNFSS
jgi:tetratricopeptide (TPR) repeat protein